MGVASGGPQGIMGSLYQFQAKFIILPNSKLGIAFRRPQGFLEGHKAAFAAKIIVLPNNNLGRTSSRPKVLWSH